MKFEPKVKLQLWDTAGSDSNFNSLTRLQFNDAHGAIVVYDVTSRATMENSVKWINRVRECAPKDCVFALVENKCDMVDSKARGSERVQESHGQKLAREHSIPIFWRVSAKEGHGIEEMIQELALAIYLKQMANPREKRGSSIVRRRDF